MKCPHCQSEDYSIWSRKKGQFKCKNCRRVFMHHSNPNRGIIKDGKRWCYRCQEWKPLEDFTVKKYRGKERARSRCKTCDNLSNKEYDGKDAGRRYSKYGITKQIFEDYKEKHNHCCPICNNKLTKRISVDHNHITNTFRGVICAKCNTVLGMADDNIMTLQKAIIYLQTNGTM